MRILKRLFSSPPDPRDTVRDLWQRVVMEARDPYWYHHGVADTLEGRFDMVSAVLALVMLRMEREPDLAALTGPLTEVFVADMDGQLRQSGVGDLTVGKQIGKLMASLGGRIGAFRAALAGTPSDLEPAVYRNITLVDDRQTMLIAGRLRKLAARLDETGAQALLAGELA
jgi:cytochrome b pre-mRNA-processing protein 3